MTIADRISELRKSREMSQEELAEMAGVSRQAVSKWESEQSVPDMYNIVTLSEIFKVTTDYLLKGVEPIDERPERKNKPARAYNIIATALNIIGLLIALGFVEIERDYQVGTLVGFVFMVLGIMTFMLGTTRITPREQISNACRFFSVNVWIIAFAVFSMIYNAMAGNAIVPVPLGTTVTHYNGKLYVNGYEANMSFLHFVRDVAPSVFVIVYSLFSAATTYILTVIERKSMFGNVKLKETGEEPASDIRN